MLIRNTAANLSGQLLYPLLALVLVPVYVRHLGVEGYGLIGLLALSVSLLGVFSRGLGTAIQREFGRRNGTPAAASLRRFLRSVEVLYWALGAALAVALGLVAQTVGPRWIRTEAFSSETVRICLLWLAVRVSLAFPHSVYQSAFLGLQRQVLGNVLNAAIALTSAAGGLVAVLVFDSVIAFYISECVNAAVHLIILRTVAFRILPDGPAQFDRGEVRALLRISLALIWTNGIGLLITNLDRLAVTAVLPLASLGAYTVAVMGGRLVTLLYNPYLQAVYPQTCHVALHGTIQDQTRDLLRSAAVLAVLAAACGFPLSVFSAEILTLWVRDAGMVRTGAPAMAIYVIGSLSVAFAAVFYQWQTATGRTGFAVRFNTIALFWFPPLLWTLVSLAGLQGAALTWAVYGLAAWIGNVLATFRPGALPVQTRGPYLRLMFTALMPAVLLTAAARAVADAWFADALWGRIACALTAGLLSGLWALWFIVPRGGIDETWRGRLDSPRAYPDFFRGRS
ncbi:MAG TPA: oligosaccharide flippase family protein [Gemmatimonadaceae bacterium]|nr:oligosaccharide flippase family protein [Gemmatimonadaceae bacterium]